MGDQKENRSEFGARFDAEREPDDDGRKIIHVAALGIHVISLPAVLLGGYPTKGSNRGARTTPPPPQKQCKHTLLDMFVTKDDAETSSASARPSLSDTPSSAPCHGQQ